MSSPPLRLRVIYCPGPGQRQIDSLFPCACPTMVAVNDLYAIRFDVPGGAPLDEWDRDEQQGDDEDLEADVKTTFAHFGLAYYEASVLEHEIVNILVVNRLITAQQEDDQLLSDPWNDKFKATTMGMLIRQLEPYMHTDSALAADLVEALELRNHLAHRFWRERAEDFCTEDGRTRMITYLIKARKHFENVDRRLTDTIGTEALQRWGVTRDVIDAWYNDALKQVARGELNVPLSTIQSTRQALLSRVTPPTS